MITTEKLTAEQFNPHRRQTRRRTWASSLPMSARVKCMPSWRWIAPAGAERLSARRRCGDAGGYRRRLRLRASLPDNASGFTTIELKSIISALRAAAIIASRHGAPGRHHPGMGMRWSGTTIPARPSPCSAARRWCCIRALDAGSQESLFTILLRGRDRGSCAADKTRDRS